MGVTLDRSASAQRKYILKRLMEFQEKGLIFRKNDILSKVRWFFDSGLVFLQTVIFLTIRVQHMEKLEGGGAVTLDRSASAQRKYILKRLMEVQEQGLIFRKNDILSKVRWFFDSGLVFLQTVIFLTLRVQPMGQSEGGGGVTLDRSASAQRKYLFKRLMEVQEQGLIFRKNDILSKVRWFFDSGLVFLQTVIFLTIRVQHMENWRGGGGNFGSVR